MAISRRHFLAASGAAALTASVRAQAPTYTLETIAAGKTLKDAGGRVVLSYLTSKPEGVPLAGNSVCCIHPFNTPGGECATDIAPPDHRDHRGIFFAWHDMTFARGGQTVKGDFWGWGQYAPVKDRVIVNTGVSELKGGQTAEFLVSNHWMIGADRVMQATETIRPVSLSSSGPMARILDLRYVFTSDYEVTINKMAFTGFCFRARKEGPYISSTTPTAGGRLNASRTQIATRLGNGLAGAEVVHSHRVTLQNGGSGGVVGRGSIIEAILRRFWHGARGVSFLRTPHFRAKSRDHSRWQNR
jgi:hypothetical protein